MSYRRRTTAERQAEAAVYRARSEAVTIPTVILDLCKFDKSRKVLTLESGYIGMPSQFFVKSHHTGKEVRFVAIGPEDKLFDQDGWDGEQCIYRPIGDVSNVDHMVIYNQH